MKSTLVMLAVIATFIATWMVTSFICWSLSEPGISFREAASHGGMFFFMLVLGWIPSLIVGADVYSKLDNQ